jgi:hypothetical protein
MMASLFETQSYEDKNHSPMRELKIAPKPGKQGKPGMIDPALFKGDNHLYAVMDEYGHWGFKYKNGILPDSLKQGKFTKLSGAVDHARKYFDKRDLDIVEVIDVHAP